MTHIWQMFKPLHFQAFPSVVGWVGSYGGNGMSNIDHFIQDFEINLYLSLSSHVLQVRISVDYVALHVVLIAFGVLFTWCSGAL